MRIRFILLLLFLLPVPLFAQEEVDDRTFGGWEFFEVNKDFGSSLIYASFYFEHDNFQYRRLDNWYTRSIVGVKIFPWLKADVAYDFMKEPSRETHHAMFDIIGTLKLDNFTITLRERYRHSWDPAACTQSNEMRSRLKIQYAIPRSRFSPYVAIEPITWAHWIKTRHYVACNYNITNWFQLEAYYLYYTYRSRPDMHVIGLGANFYL